MLPPRRHEISRLEAFSDAVFAFALTLLARVPRRAEAVRRSDDADGTRIALGAHLVSAGVGLVAIVIARFAPMPLPMFSGFTYFLMGPAHWAFGVSAGRRRKTIESRLAPVVGV